MHYHLLHALKPGQLWSSRSLLCVKHRRVEKKLYIYMFKKKREKQWYHICAFWDQKGWGVLWLFLFCCSVEELSGEQAMCSLTSGQLISLKRWSRDKKSPQEPLHWFLSVSAECSPDITAVPESNISLWSDFSNFCRCFLTRSQLSATLLVAHCSANHFDILFNFPHFHLLPYFCVFFHAVIILHKEEFCLLDLSVKRLSEKPECQR